MHRAEWSEFWWQEITGPQTVVKSVANALCDHGAVMLAIPNDLPWRHEMRLAVASEVRLVLGDVAIKTVDAADQIAEGEAPGDFLLEKYALQAVQLRYRPGRQSIQDFLIKEQVLKNTLVWVKGLDEQHRNEWLEFCQNYNARSAADGLFVIEAADAVGASEGKHEYVSYESNVGRYDAQLFSSLVLSGGEFDEYSDAWRRYIASAMAKICGTDVEVANDLLHSVDFKEEDPIKKVGELALSPEYARRGSGATSTHPFALCRSNREDNLEKRLWGAQIEVLFPLIEAERVRIIEGLEYPLNHLIHEKRVTQFDEVVDNAYDIELGTLTYLMGSGKLDVPDPQLRSRIFLLRDCRNNLAHRDCCSLEQVNKLLN